MQQIDCNFVLKIAEQKLIEPLIETSETYAKTETSLTILLKIYYKRQKVWMQKNALKAKNTNKK